MNRPLSPVLLYRCTRSRIDSLATSSQSSTTGHAATRRGACRRSCWIPSTTLPRDRFVAGLGAFLVAHVAYVVGFWVDDPPGDSALWIGLVAAVVVVSVVARRILRGLQASGATELVAPVAGYMAVIALMAVSATGTGLPLAVAGAWLFRVSDALIGWHRFVRPLAWAPVTIMVTYHLAQAGLVLSLR